MKAQHVLGTILALFLLLWMGGLFLGFVSYIMHQMIRLALLVLVVLVIVQLVTARRRY